MLLRAALRLPQIAALLQSFAAVGPSVNGAMAIKSTDQIGGNYTTNPAIAWDSEAYDNGGWHDNVTNNSRLTVPSGVAFVIVSANVRVENGGNEQVSLAIGKNGSVTYDGYPSLQFLSGTNSYSLSVTSGPIPVIAGDFFEANMNAIDAAIDVIAARSSFSIYEVG